MDEHSDLGRKVPDFECEDEGSEDEDQNETAHDINLPICQRPIPARDATFQLNPDHNATAAPKGTATPASLQG